MNIIYLITRLKKGAGPVNQAYNLATGMMKLGVNFTIVCISPEITGNTWEQRFIEAKIPVVHFDLSSKDYKGCKKALNEYVEKNHIDIIHSSGLRPDFFNVQCKKRVKHITTQRCEPENIGEGSNFLAKFLMTKIMLFTLRRQEYIVACSKSLSNYINYNYDFKSTFIQNGVDVDYFKPIDEKTKLRYREELGLPLNKKLFLYCGIFLPRKDIPTLLKAFLKQPSERVLVLVGGEKEEIDLLKEEYKQDNILFIGKKSAPLKYLQCADYSISASLSEGLPNSILESLACGVPVILSDIDPHREVLESGKVGKLFHCKDLNSLAKAIEEAEKIDYQILKNECLSCVESTFNKYITAKKYKELYTQILSNN